MPRQSACRQHEFGQAQPRRAPVCRYPAPLINRSRAIEKQSDMNKLLEAHERGDYARPPGMVPAVISRSASLPAASGISNPYLQFSQRESGQDIVGALLRFSKGEYLAGDKRDPRRHRDAGGRRCHHRRVGSLAGEAPDGTLPRAYQRRLRRAHARGVGTPRRSSSGRWIATAGLRTRGRKCVTCR